MTIFSSLQWELSSKAHSCNVSKPWCRRCAKCVYVWLFYLAFLDEKKVTKEIFGGEVLFDIEENKNILRMLAGKDVQTPFECVGQPAETMLALAMCEAKGYQQEIVRELLEDYPVSKLVRTAEQQLTLSESFLAKCELPEKLSNYYLEDLEPLLEAKKSEILRFFKH